MTWTYDPATDTPLNRVRLLVTDTIQTRPLFQDEELQSFLLLERNRIFAAAALAIETMATNQAYVLKVITHNGISTNGASVAAELRLRAQKLRDEQLRIDHGEDVPGTSVLIAPVVTDTVPPLWQVGEAIDRWYIDHYGFGWL